MPLTARGTVTARIARRARRFPQLFPSIMEIETLQRREGALARAIDQAVARRWLTLTAVLESRLSRPWTDLNPPVQAALLVGAAQLLLLDRLPDHAIIYEAVAWTKARSRPAARLVNAVLRRVADLRGDRVAREGVTYPLGPDELPLHDGRVLLLREPVFADDPLARLSQQTSHPQDLLERWALRDEAIDDLAAHNLVHPPIIVTGFEPSTPPGRCEAHDEHGFAVFDPDHQDLDRLLQDHPSVRVQDPGAAWAVAATKGLMPDLVVDTCAGHGTKTRQLEELHPQARIVATDRNDAKLTALRKTFRGHDRVLVVEFEQLVEYAGQAQLVVVDPPCTNTAVLARRTEARYRLTPENLGKLVDVQRQTVADALRLLAKPGHLLYSTCSLEPEENQEQVKWMTRWHRLRVRREGRRVPRGRPGEAAGGYADGSFFALVERG